jgi:hypothetical protein
MASADNLRDRFMAYTAKPSEFHAIESGDGGGHDGGMESRVSKLEALIPTLATKADVGEVRGDIHKMDASIVRWMLATVVGLFLGFAGLFFALSNSLKPSAAPVAAQAQAPQPIVIQLPAAPASTPPLQPAKQESSEQKPAPPKP